MKHTALAAFIALFSSSIHAEEQPFYLKASLGYTQFDSDSSYTIKEDLDSVSYGFTFGYRINQYIAIEAGMTDLGKLERRSGYELYDAEIYGDQDYQTVFNASSYDHTKTEYKSYSLGAAFTKRFQQHLSAGVRLGVHQWNTTSSGSGNYEYSIDWYSPDGELLESESYAWSGDWGDEKDSGTDSYYGAVISWSTGAWDIGLEHTLYKIEDEKANFTALGATYSF
ncbi:outer membrane beta-barrel protein [Microbulbifer sp. SSSA002]|uniref:outer membrane beta-barrel protein n=1 Tax=unclassified Microbulbifer TaxID=2619833 RepID=UPI00403A16C7